MKKPVIAVSVGDLNGVGMDIILRAHAAVSQLCRPLYCISPVMAQQAAALLQRTLPEDFETSSVEGDFVIEPGKVSAASGRYAFDSFRRAIALAESGKADAITTLPIHKEAWAKAGVPYKGHTDMLRDHFGKDAIMMLGCEKLYVALFTEHIPLRRVADSLSLERLRTFFLDFHRAVGDEEVAVLGLNPHAGDNGVLGDEESMITAAIDEANRSIGKTLFSGPVVPDIAFTPAFRSRYRYMIAMYHDQGLAPLKALYFDESVNISLNLPIIRTSVDHGTAFDIAYRSEPKTLSYRNAISAAVSLLGKR
jgi:4-hydroxythreonine-4-phosphate dehydrogenase